MSLTCNGGQTPKSGPNCDFPPALNVYVRAGPIHVSMAIGSTMGVIATIMNSATGQPIQKMTFGRMPKPWASFNLATGELVTADRVHIGKPAPGKFIAPVEVWVTLKS